MLLPNTVLHAIPHYVKKPSASDCDTCLCATCLNPELKSESLVNKTYAKSWFGRNRQRPKWLGWAPWSAERNCCEKYIE